MDYFWAVCLGFIQGLTEFWPVSSSGHLLIFHDFSGFLQKDSLTFDVALHFGTLLAVMVYFRRDLLVLLQGFLRSFKKWQPAIDHNQRLAWQIIAACLPAVIVGALLRDLIVDYLRSPWIVVVTLITVALVFLLVERRYRGLQDLRSVTLRSALLIGGAQVLSFIPGVSRSGITIITGMMTGLKREQAARFSFLLSAPIVVGAAVKEFFSWWQRGFVSHDLSLATIGVAVSFGSGLLAIRFLLRILKKYSLRPFAYYRLVLGIAVALLLLVR